jgi:hypothetical protein
MSVVSKISPVALGGQVGFLARSGMPAGRDDDPQLDRMADRVWIAVGLGVVLWSLFLFLWFVSPGMSVLRSEQTRGELSVATPVETVDAFRAIAGFERCAVANGGREVFGKHWSYGVMAGVSNVSYTHWRDECGGMSLVFPAYQAGEQARAQMGDLIGRLRAAGERLGEASVAGTATDAMFERAARDFHAAAREAGLGYRLVSWVRR